MKTIAVALLGLALTLTASAEDKKSEKKVVKVTAEEIGKEFKADPKAAKAKYADVEIQISGEGTTVIGTGADSELLVSTDAKVTIRIETSNRPTKFPAQFTATAKFKSYFEMGNELALTASKMTYAK